MNVLNTGKVMIGLLHTKKPVQAMSGDALRLQRALTIKTQPTLIERLWLRVRGF